MAVWLLPVGCVLLVGVGVDVSKIVSDVPGQAQSPEAPGTRPSKPEPSRALQRAWRA